MDTCQPDLKKSVTKRSYGLKEKRNLSLMIRSMKKRSVVMPALKCYVWFIIILQDDFSGALCG
jgi:hypothetical protein